jgi:hypothetical protein
MSSVVLQQKPSLAAALHRTREGQTRCIRAVIPGAPRDAVLWAAVGKQCEQAEPLIGASAQVVKCDFREPDDDRDVAAFAVTFCANGKLHHGTLEAQGRDTAFEELHCVLNTPTTLELHWKNL